MREQFLAALPVVGIRRDRCYDVPGCIVRQQCLPRPAGVHLILADPWSEEWGSPQVFLGVRPASKKRGADKGIDGRILFHDDPTSKKTKEIVISVKSGGVSVAHVRDLRGVIQREKAEFGELITLRSPTQPMCGEAASAGLYTSLWGSKHPRIQILTIEELLDEKQIDYPTTRRNVTFREAPREKEKAEQLRLARVPE